MDREPRDKVTITYATYMDLHPYIVSSYIHTPLAIKTEPT